MVNVSDARAVASHLTIASIFNSWEDEDRNRYFPLIDFPATDGCIIVAVRDGCNGMHRAYVTMTLEEVMGKASLPNGSETS